MKYFILTLYLIAFFTVGLSAQPDWKLIRETPTENSLINTEYVNGNLYCSGIEVTQGSTSPFLWILSDNGEVILDTLYLASNFGISGVYPSFLKVDSLSGDIFILGDSRKRGTEGEISSLILIHLDSLGSQLNLVQLPGLNISHNSSYRSRVECLWNELNNGILSMYYSDGTTEYPEEDRFNDIQWLRRVDYNILEKELLSSDSLLLTFGIGTEVIDNGDSLFFFTYDTSTTIMPPPCSVVDFYYQPVLFKIDKELNSFTKLKSNGIRPSASFRFQFKKGFDGNVIRLGYIDTLLCGRGAQYDYYFDRFDSNLEFLSDYYEGGFNYWSEFNDFALNEEDERYIMCGFDLDIFGNQGMISSLYEFDQSMDGLLSKKTIDWKDFRASKIIESSDGNYYVCGNYYPVGAQGLFLQAAVIKVDREGNILMTTAIEEPVEDFGLVNIYPNPASSSLNIEVDVLLVHSEFSLFSSTGQVMRKVKLEQRRTDINIDDLIPGVYFYTITKSNGAVIDGKLVIE